MHCLLCHAKIPRLRAWTTKSEFCSDEHAAIYKKQTLERLLTDQAPEPRVEAPTLAPQADWQPSPPQNTPLESEPEPPPTELEPPTVHEAQAADSPTEELYSTLDAPPNTGSEASSEPPQLGGVEEDGSQWRDPERALEELWKATGGIDSTTDPIPDPTTDPSGPVGSSTSEFSAPAEPVASPDAINETLSSLEHGLDFAALGSNGENAPAEVVEHQSAEDALAALRQIASGNDATGNNGTPPIETPLTPIDAGHTESTDAEGMDAADTEEVESLLARLTEEPTSAPLEAEALVEPHTSPVDPAQSDSVDPVVEPSVDAELPDGADHAGLDFDIDALFGLQSDTQTGDETEPTEVQQGAAQSETAPEPAPADTSAPHEGAAAEEPVLEATPAEADEEQKVVEFPENEAQEAELAVDSSPEETSSEVAASAGVPEEAPATKKPAAQSKTAQPSDAKPRRAVKRRVQRVKPAMRLLNLKPKPVNNVELASFEDSSQIEERLVKPQTRLLMNGQSEFAIVPPLIEPELDIRIRLHPADIDGSEAIPGFETEGQRPIKRAVAPRRPTALVGELAFSSPLAALFDHQLSDLLPLAPSVAEPEWFRDEPGATAGRKWAVGLELLQAATDHAEGRSPRHDPPRRQLSPDELEARIADYV